jgi:hypothetical protein
VEVGASRSRRPRARTRGTRSYLRPVRFVLVPPFFACAVVCARLAVLRGAEVLRRAPGSGPTTIRRRLTNGRTVGVFLPSQGEVAFDRPLPLRLRQGATASRGRGLAESGSRPRLRGKGTYAVTEHTTTRCGVLGCRAEDWPGEIRSSSGRCRSSPSPSFSRQPSSPPEECLRFRLAACA